LSKPCGCGRSFGDTACTNTCDEWVFIFGSCRQFYEDPCLKDKPVKHPFMRRLMHPFASSSSGCQQ
jgi:hypothetical protein